MRVFSRRCYTQNTRRLQADAQRVRARFRSVGFAAVTISSSHLLQWSSVSRERDPNKSSLYAPYVLMSYRYKRRNGVLSTQTLALVRPRIFQAGA